MNFIFNLFAICSCLIQVAHSSDEAILKSVKSATSTLSSIENPKNACSYCSSDPLPHDPDCPNVVKHSYKEIYRMGTVGVINKLLSDGSLKDPRTVCKTSASAISNVQVEDVYKDLQSQYPKTRPLYQFSQKCNEGIYKEKANIATSFMAYDFNFKSNSIQAALINLLDSKAQIASMIGDNTQGNCQEISIEIAKNHCLELNKCPKKKDNYIFTVKSEELFQTLSKLRTVNDQYNELLNKLETELLSTVKQNLYSYKRDGKSFEKEKELRDKIQEAKNTKTDTINAILNLNPVLKGENFKSILSKTIPEKHDVKSVAPAPDDLKRALFNELQLSQKESAKKIKKYNNAYSCLTGNNSKCDEFEDLLKESKYLNHDDESYKTPALATVANFYNCVERVGEFRNEADSVVNESLIGGALSLTPFVFVSGAKLGLTLSRTANAVSKLTKVEGTVNAAATGVGLAYGGFQTKETYDQCKKAEKEFENLASHQKVMSCDNLENILINKSNSSSCASEAIMSAALLAPALVPSTFKLVKNYAKYKKELRFSVPEKIRNLPAFKSAKQSAQDYVDEHMRLSKLVNHSPDVLENVAARMKKIAEPLSSSKTASKKMTVEQYNKMFSDLKQLASENGITLKEIKQIIGKGVMPKGLDELELVNFGEINSLDKLSSVGKAQQHELAHLFHTVLARIAIKSGTGSQADKLRLLQIMEEGENYAKLETVVTSTATPLVRYGAASEAGRYAKQIDVIIDGVSNSFNSGILDFKKSPDKFTEIYAAFVAKHVPTYVGKSMTEAAIKVPVYLMTPSYFASCIAANQTMMGSDRKCSEVITFYTDALKAKPTEE